MKANGEGIYASRPYRKHREGKTELPGGAFKEGKAEWKPTDFRFTTKGNAVYAFMMRAGESKQAVISTLGKVSGKQITSVQVAGRRAEFVQKDGALLVRLHEGLDRSMPVCIRAAF
jgi:alpha-L-fucosidase